MSEIEQDAKIEEYLKENSKGPKETSPWQTNIIDQKKSSLSNRRSRRISHDLYLLPDIDENHEPSKQKNEPEKNNPPLPLLRHLATSLINFFSYPIKTSVLSEETKFIDFIDLPDDLEVYPKMIKLSPNAKILDSIPPNIQRKVRSLCAMENAIIQIDGDFTYLILSACVLIDEVTRDCFIRTIQVGDTPILPSQIIEANSNSEIRGVLEDFLSGNLKLTMGITQIWVESLSKLIRTGQPDALEWLSTFFESKVIVGKEPFDFINIFNRRCISKFLNVTRVDYRNPLAHGEFKNPITLQEYAKWNVMVFGSNNVNQWTEVGPMQFTNTPLNSFLHLILQGYNSKHQF